MRAFFKPLIILILIATGSPGFGQESGDDEYELRMAQAAEYKSLSLFAESRLELEAAILLATEQHSDEKRLNATIALGELLRKIQEFEAGVVLLKSIPESEGFPELHVRKLGRLAALYIEYADALHMNRMDTGIMYLKEALALAEDSSFELEMASLKNELGCVLFRDQPIHRSMELFREAAAMFLNAGDTQNYANVLTHLLDGHQRMGNCERADSVAQILLTTVKEKGWHVIEKYTYDLLAVECENQGDMLGYYEWKLRSEECNELLLKAINSRQMAALRVLKETQKYQQEAEESGLLAEQKGQQLEKETKRGRELFVYLIVLGALVLGVLGLLFRERTLKRKVDQANEKYHTLIVESNHRIKNNLQMVISMLEYASKGMEGEDGKALKRMSGKIHTISALHRHLYMDVHNERVDLDTYFGEIVSMYKNIATSGFEIVKRIDPIEIKSERIVYFGLIFNELLTNTLEHSVAAISQVKLDVVSKGDHFTFSYSDGSRIHPDAHEGMGGMLIKQLIKRVGGKGFNLTAESGTYQFTFYA